tara:strand:+ start:1052 stop:1393 length:342 start_codon:yes stop_codon:yes gene_type:complete
MADQWEVKARDTWHRLNSGPPYPVLTIAAALRSAYEQGKRDEREHCAQVADDWAEKNRKQSVRLAKRASRLGNDPFGHGDLAHAGSSELDSCAMECEALAAAIRSRSTTDASE